MNLQHLNRVCFAICMICIVFGTAMSVTLIWTGRSGSEFLSRGLLTDGTLFLASMLTMTVSRAFGKPQRDLDPQ